jgi:hypothetical protein
MHLLRTQLAGDPLAAGWRQGAGTDYVPPTHPPAFNQQHPVHLL